MSYDAYFLKLIKQGRIVIDSSGNIINPKTGECIHSQKVCKGIRIGHRKIDAQRLVWLGMFGPVPKGYRIQAVNKNANDRDPFNMRLIYDT